MNQPYRTTVLYRRLLGYVAPYWYLFVLSFAGFALYALGQMGFARWMEYIIDSLEQNQLDNRLGIALAVVGIFLLRGLGGFSGQYSLAWLARKLIHTLRTELFAKILRLPAGQLQQQSDGQLLARLTYNVEQVAGAATDALQTLLREGMTVIGLFGYLLYLNWKLTLVIVAVGPLIGISVGIAARRFRKLARRIQHSVGDVTESAQQAVRAFDIIRIFGLQAQEKQRFHAASEYNRQQFMKMVVAQAINTPVVQLMVALAMAVLVYLAMSPALLSDMSTGEFIAFLTAAGMIAKPLRQVTEVNSIIQRGLAAAQSLFELQDSASEPDNGQQRLPKAQGRLELDTLCFCYPGSEQPVLSELSLTLEPGQTVALVGASGSGKSTLAALLPRFYQPTAGEIRLDGMPLQAIRLGDLRQQIALVNQQVVLFEGTIADNIAYGELAGCNRAQIEAAARAAHINEFSDRLPDGLDTQLGSTGIQLSGGQRQRIAIARAILKDAPVLILDEATSALDNHAECHIQAALQPLMRNRTCLVIAHRLSTIEHADRIVVLAQGRIVEQGSHTELLARDGAYAALHRLQFSDNPPQTS